MKAITCTYADCVEALVVVNDDEEPEAIKDRLEEANVGEDRVHVQIIEPCTIAAAIDYLRSA